METHGVFPNTIQKLLLSCGTLATMLFLGTNSLAGMLLKG